MPTISRRAAAAAVAIALAMALIGFIALMPRSGPVAAQGDDEDRIAALETQVADLERRVGVLERTAATPKPNEPRPDPTPASEERPSEEEPSGPVGTFANPVPFGQEAEIGPGWTMRVVDVIPNATDQVMAANQFNDPPAEGHQFFIITVAITNNSDQPASASLVAIFSAVGQTAVSYEPFEDRCGSIPNELPDSEVFPGGTVEGNVCFSVRAEDVESLILYTDSFLTFDTDDRVYFALR